LVRTDLDGFARRGCGNPECRERHDALEAINLVARCHTGAAVHVRYSVLRRALRVTCAKCQRPIAEIAVADVWREDAALGGAG
jgi:hypothetical protein